MADNSFYIFKQDPTIPLYEPHKVVFKAYNGDVQYELPYDVIISINGNKLIAQSQIIDGVVAYERITRKPFDIDFSFTLRQINNKKWVFPISELSNFDYNVWTLDGVIDVENSMLNGMGIFKIIIETVQYTTIAGSTDMPVKLKCLEDVYSSQQLGQTLII